MESDYKNKAIDAAPKSKTENDPHAGKRDYFFSEPGYKPTTIWAADAEAAEAEWHRIKQSI